MVRVLSIEANQFFELLRFVASQDEVTKDVARWFFRASDLLYAVNGDNLDFFVFVGLTNKVDDAYVPESATLGAIGGRAGSEVFFIHVASVCGRILKFGLDS